MRDQVQNAMIERNVGMPADQRIDFRIGIHLGDVVEGRPAGDLMGDGVNVAARLEGIAKPGMICLSEEIFLPPHQGTARSCGNRSRTDAAQEHRGASAGIFGGGGHSR